MLKKIGSYFKNESLKIQIIATLIATLIIWIITVIVGMVKGLNIYSSIQWTLDILNFKINVLWFLSTLIVFFFIISRMNKKTLNKINELTYSKQKIDYKIKFLEKRINAKLDTSRFERFNDVYDYRRLKNHPFHEQYSSNDIESFIEILRRGNKESDIYDLENGMSGLILELKEAGSIHSSLKNEIKEEIQNCFTDKFLHQKEELNKILDTIKIY
ncbi:hypothetical protein A5M85_12400 [Cellulophaga lytica]|uniref:hypothetical protein n=1 Tax=Cellulophaga lytica TaxID=979 RepID=UPI0009506C89|nr:hypothetical protein [Cellulophaga lytica]APU11055.1 hypothetical protein A5M85_12400 [Cellulophaga lytica]